MSAQPAVAPPAPAPAPPPMAPDGPARVASEHRPLLPRTGARLVGFVALAGFGALQWADMVRPSASTALLGSVGAAAIAGALLGALARSRPRATVRIAATLLAAAILLLVALAASGVPVHLFGPRNWDDLGAGIAQGLGAVWTVRTPYGGLDEWTRIVLALGGCALIGIAALLAFMPRRDGCAGFPAAAAIALGALYTVAVMQHDVALPWLAGLMFTLLLAVFLWLERLRRRDAGFAAAVVAVAALAGYAAAPTLDRDRPLLDYEQIGRSLSASATTQYRWNHEYGPLDWPRDGREVLRVRARKRSYWKAVNLVAFDGTRWVQGADHRRDRLETKIFNPAWRHTIRVTMRALRTPQFVAAGSTIDIVDSPRKPTSSTPGTYESAAAPLRRGHAYRAIVYTPRPTTAQMRAASADYPPELARDYRVMRVPIAGSGAATLAFPLWNEAGAPTAVGPGPADPSRMLEQSPYGPVYALARRLRAGASTPYEYVRAVERHLAHGFSYSESPPHSSVPLAAFLLRDRTGYCQQFSGAMALLLRMGGVPARVASGFSPGSLDRERREYVVRDVDAHSWVELYLPGIGWTTRDPTPAESPARRGPGPAAGSQDETVTFGGSERTLGRSPDAGTAGVEATAGDEQGGSSAAILAGAAIAVLILAGGVALLVSRRRRRSAAGKAHDDVDLGELLRALQRSGRPPPPGLTLAALADRLTAAPAQDYVRTLADARYGYGGGPPTRMQRAALRRELGAGLGRLGRLRSWWALPPRATRRPPA